MSDITTARLFNQRLLGEGFITPEEVVGWLGAVQAQDFPAAKWGVGLRLREKREEIVDAAFEEGRIIRTHIMRPTWHFVLPEDLKWMQELTSPYVKKLMSHYNRKLELNDEVFKKSEKVIVKALQEHRYLTRQEIKKLLEGIGITTDVQRLAHLVMWPELEAVICSGPKKGKQQSYALVDERIKNSKKMGHEDALASLALTYFTSHGPAQLKDFSWWSGLPMTKAIEALELIKPKLHSQTHNDKTYWFAEQPITKSPQTTTAFLLSIYDEYTIAYKDRSDLSRGDKRDIENMISMGNALTAVLIIDGRVAGTWKRTLKKNSVEITVKPFTKLSTEENTALEKQVAAYGSFLHLTPHLTISPDHIYRASY